MRRYNSRRASAASYSKYGAVKSAGSDGYIYDSKKEMRYYEEKLLPLLKSGAIVSIDRQVRFALLDAFAKNGKKYRAITYLADFVVVWENGRTEVYDVKGFETEVFKIKHKMFEYLYPDLKLEIV